MEYLIQWKGYDPIHNSWEPEEYLNEEALESYKAKQSDLHDGPSKHEAVEVRGNYVSAEVVKEPEFSKRIKRGSKGRGSKRKRSS